MPDAASQLDAVMGLGWSDRLGGCPSGFSSQSERVSSGTASPVHLSRNRPDTVGEVGSGGARAAKREVRVAARGTARNQSPSCLAAERYWDQARWAIGAYAWRFDGLERVPRTGGTA